MPPKAQPKAKQQAIPPPAPILPPLAPLPPQPPIIPLPTDARYTRPTPPTFTGQAGSRISAKTWLKRFDDYVEDTGRQALYLRTFRSYIDDLARDWLDAQGFQPNTPVDQIKAAFLDHFKPSEEQKQLEISVLEGTPQGTRTVDQYSDDFERASLDLDLNDQAKLLLYKRNLNPTIQILMPPAFTSFQHCKQKAREAEARARMYLANPQILALFSSVLVPKTATSTAVATTPAVPSQQISTVELNEPMPDVAAASLSKRPYQPSSASDQPPFKRSRTLSPNQFSSFNEQRQKDRREGRCFRCHQLGHIMRECSRNRGLVRTPSLNTLTGPAAGQLYPVPMMITPPMYPNWPLMPTSPIIPTNPMQTPGQQSFLGDGQLKTTPT
jgi:hypothetical protein